MELRAGRMQKPPSLPLSPHAVGLLQMPLCVDGNDLEQAVVQVEANHTAVGVDDADLETSNVGRGV